MNKKYDYDLVVSLYKEGKSIREVAIVIGGNHSRVAEIVKKAGVSRPNKVRKHILEQNAKKCKPFSRPAHSISCIHPDRIGRQIRQSR